MTGAREWVVPSAAVATINAAVDSATNGDSIRITQDRHEPYVLNVNKSVLIQTDPGVVLTYDEAVYVTAEDVTLKGGIYEGGLAIYEDNATVEAGTFATEYTTYFGAIYLMDDGRNGATIRDAHFTGVNRAISSDAITQIGCSPCCFLSLADVTVDKCVFEDVGSAINLGCNGYATVTGSVFNGCYDVLEGYYDEANTTFERNIVLNVDDVFPEECPSVVENNIFYDNTTIGCTVNWSVNLDEDPLFCDGREGTGTYTLRMDSPAARENNDMDVDIGPYGVECAWGTLARSTGVGPSTSVLVLEDVTVPADMELKLDEGVALRFDEDDNSSGGSSASKNELIVNGTLKAAGGAGTEVVFESAKETPAEGDWYMVNASAAQAMNIQHAIFRHANTGLVTKGSGSGLVKGCMFSDNEMYDIYVGAAGSGVQDTLLDNTLWVKSGNGISLVGTCDGVVVENNTIFCDSALTNAGILHSGGSSSPLFIGNTIQDAETGYGIRITGGDPTIVENTISNNKYGIYVSSGTPYIGTSSSSSDNFINGGNLHGIYVSGSGAAPVVRNNRINSNTYGVTKKSSGSPNLGTSYDYGNNDLSGNSSYCIWNQTATSITADGNYFGTCDGGGNPPVCWSGPIFYTTNLCLAPAGGVDVDVEPVPEAMPLLVRGVRPNPMPAQGSILFELGRPVDHLSIDIYDVTGRLVRTMEQSRLGVGTQEIAWDGLDGTGRRIPVGLYFVRLTTNEHLTQTTKVVVSR